MRSMRHCSSKYKRIIRDAIVQYCFASTAWFQYVLQRAFVDVLLRYPTSKLKRRTPDAYVSESTLL